MSEEDHTLPNDVGDSGSFMVRVAVPDNTSPLGCRYPRIKVYPAKIVEDLRNQLALANRIADEWKKRADELETVIAKAKETG